MKSRKRWLITGATGQLGGHILRQLSLGSDDQEILAISRSPLNADFPASRIINLTEKDKLANCIAQYKPTHIIHTGAITAVNEAFTNPELAKEINVNATRIIAESRNPQDCRMVFTSTDMVFDGTSPPYREDSSPAPLSQYGNSKLMAEQSLNDMPNTLTIRLPLMYGFAATSRSTTFANQIQCLKEGKILNLFTDEFRTPIWLTDAAAALIALAQSDITGILHLGGPQRLSRFDVLTECARILGVQSTAFVEVSRLSIESSEPRPEDLSLDSSRFLELMPEFAPGPIRREVFEGNY